MKDMKVSELSGWMLDYWVAKAKKCNPLIKDSAGEKRIYLEMPVPLEGMFAFSPSTNWEQGGEIIERERITVETWPGYWAALYYGDCLSIQTIAKGPTPLIAAMRAYVASAYGYDVPDFGN